MIANLKLAITIVGITLISAALVACGPEPSPTPGPEPTTTATSEPTATAAPVALAPTATPAPTATAAPGHQRPHPLRPRHLRPGLDRNSSGTHPNRDGNSRAHRDSDAHRNPDTHGHRDGNSHAHRDSGTYCHRRAGTHARHRSGLRSLGRPRHAYQRPRLLHQAQRGAARPGPAITGVEGRLRPRGGGPARAGTSSGTHGVQRHRALCKAGDRRIP